MDGPTVHADTDIENNAAELLQLHRRGRIARTIIRVFAVVRFIITITASFIIVEFLGANKKYYGGKMISPDELIDETTVDDPVKRIEKILNEYIKVEIERHEVEEERAERLFRFHRWLAVGAVNILVTGLLWAAAFASKRRCLPVYVLLEIVLVTEVYVQYDSTLTIVSVARILFLVLFASLAAYYYKFLESKERTRHRLLTTATKQPENQSLLRED